MALERSARPLAQCLRCTRHNRITARALSTTPATRQEETTTEPSSSAEPPPAPPSDAFGEVKPEEKQEHRYDPERVSTRRSEGRLLRLQNQLPIGSRRRRAAIQNSAQIPFEELPYQCFQEARNFLREDRAEKIAEMGQIRAKIDKETAREVPPEKERLRELRIQAYNRNLEHLKILADINDPLVKKKFEDGFGDMRKPIYRHLANLKWRNYKRQVLMQRITQMNVVPDVLPAIDPTVSTVLSFGKHKVPHGEFVLASTSEKAPSLEIQSYEKGEKLVSIAVVTPDVPNVEKDGFDYRCHFLAANVRIDPTRPHVQLWRLSKKTNIIQDWSPPYSQKGAPYQRLAVFILEQPSSIGDASTANADPVSELAGAEPSTSEPSVSSEQATSETPSETSPPAEISATAPTPETAPTSETAPTPEPTPSNTLIYEHLPIDEIKQDPRYTTSEDFRLRSFVSKYNLNPIGVDLFRSQWDETTADVMKRNGVVGHDVEFKRKRVDPLPYKRLKAERYR